MKKNFADFYGVQETDPGVQMYLAYMNGEEKERPDVTDKQIRMARLLWGKSEVDKDRPAAEQRFANVCARFRSLIMAEGFIALVMKDIDTNLSPQQLHQAHEDICEARMNLNRAIRTINEWTFCEFQFPDEIIQRAREAFDTLGWLESEVTFS